MCKHALCEHGKDKPEPPSFGSSVRDYTLAAGVVAGALALPRLGSRWVPYQAQLALACAFGAVLVGRALTTKSVQLSKDTRAALAAEPEHVEWVERARKRRIDIAERLGQAIRIETVSHDEQEEERKTEGKSAEASSSSSSASSSPSNLAPFLAMRALLERNYPLVHANLERTIINSYSLVFHWKAASPSALKPYLLTAHLDVVPVADAHLWEASGGGAFSGKILDSQFVCGRGAIDDKHAVCAIMEALEDLLATSGGKRPNRDLYVAFGHDEEIGGTNGAKYMVEHFVSKGLQFEFMLDEGLFVMDGVLPGVKESIAMVCIAEKGMVVSQYAVSVPPALAGHASAPGRESAIGILARALVAMESAPMPSYLSRGSPARLMFESVAPHAAFPFRFIFANLFLFAPVLKMILAMKNTTATIIRTTTALTVFNAGGKVRDWNNNTCAASNDDPLDLLSSPRWSLSVCMYVVVQRCSS